MKFLKKLVILVGILLMGLNLAFAEEVNEIPVRSFLPINNEAFEEDFVNISDTEKKDFFGKSSILIKDVTFIIQLLIGALASVLTISSVLSMLTTGMDSEEGMTKLKDTIIYIVMGIGLVFLAGEIGSLLSLQKGGILGAKTDVLQRVQIFDKNVDVLIALIRYTLAGLAVLFITISGVKMVAGAGSEEDAAKEKSYITYAAMGLILFLIFDNILGNIIYSIGSPFTDPTISPSGAKMELIGFTNLVVSFVGPVAILSTVIGGIMYASSGFDEEQAAKAKRMIGVSLAGIILIYAAYSIIATVVAGQF
ncbi:hypothetical protein HOJ01_01260 [bacterium]|nr:hypothetical protein [bacterium]